jgi:hypothetical protein
MYKQFLLGALALAVAAMMCLPANGQPSGATGSAGGGKAATGGGNEAEIRQVVVATPVDLNVFERVLMFIGLVLLALIVAQLTFLRSSVEKMTGERSVSNPSGTSVR